MVNVANTELSDVKILDITQLEEATDLSKTGFDAYKARHGSQISSNNLRVSQKYGTVNKSYTPEDIIRDRDYREAIKSGDMRTASRLVKEAAKEAGMATDEKGKLIDLYHGTPRHGFTTFDKDIIFTTTNESVASGYANIAPVRGTSQRYVKDDGTDATLIKNAKNVLGAEYERLTEEKLREVYDKKIIPQMQKIRDKLEPLYQMENYAVPDEISNEFWQVAYVFDDMVQYRDDYLDQERRTETARANGLIGRDMGYRDALEAVGHYRHDHRAEIEEQGGMKYFDLLLGDYDVSDALIDIDYSYAPMMEGGDRFINKASGNIEERAELQKRIEHLSKYGVYKGYGNIGNHPLIIDAKKSFWTAIEAPMIGQGYFSTDDIAKWAKTNGYTSVIIKNVLDPSVTNAYGDDYIFFNSNQFKSSETVTYDDYGNVIPLGMRYSQDTGDIRYSLRSTSRDAEYMQAVESGDEKKQRELVEQAAKDAGYTLAGYHGTKQPTLRYDSIGYGEETDYKNKRLPFTVFKAGQSGGIYIASNRDVSKGFARNFNGNPGTVMSLYVRFKNPLVVNEHVWTSVPRYYNIPTPTVMKEAGYTQETVGTEEISLFAQERGYDGVIIEGIREGTDTQTDDYIAFSPEQIKLADPVVYDDAGNVIPLSERFNQEQKDIRYSLRSQDGTATDSMATGQERADELEFETGGSKAAGDLFRAVQERRRRQRKEQYGNWRQRVSETAQTLLDETGSSVYTKQKLERELTRIFEEYEAKPNGSDMEANIAVGEALNELRGLVTELLTDQLMDDEYKEARAALKNGIYVSPDMVSELGGRAEWRDFRRTMSGFTRVYTNEAAAKKAGAVMIGDIGWEDRLTALNPGAFPAEAHWLERAQLLADFVSEHSDPTAWMDPQIHKDHAPENMAIVPHYVISALSKNNDSAKRKRKMCARNPELLLHALELILAPRETDES